MSKFVRVFALALVLVTTGISNARAASVAVDLGVASYTLSNQVLPGNIDLQSLPTHVGLQSSYDLSNGVSLTLNGAAIVTGNNKYGRFQHIKPAGVSAHEKYLAVFGQYHHMPGSAVFELAAGTTTFAFNWGSVNYNNFVTVTNGKGYTYTISGEDLIESAMTIIPGKSSVYFSLTDLAGIVKIVLSSACCTFEVSDISATPIPAALSLFGMALLGLLALRRNGFGFIA